ncbi:cytokine receptor family member B16 isoform X3 [Syngnathoides biaculeatus]|nr:cytokine receptor family member B16 isoform X3 [Syngnathoides biaculeatus]
MDSVNMRHDLRWRPPRAQCSTPLRYSVQFQGEFEATVLNGTWLDSPECQDITRAHCDLSLDLGSDSDYNVSVRARCGSRISSRAQLVAPFNRKRTALTAPDVTASAAGDALLVSFDRAPPAASVEVEVWNRDDAREQVLAFEVSAEQKQLHVTDLRRGATYCVRARLLLEGKMHSRDTRDQSRRPLEESHHGRADAAPHGGRRLRPLLVRRPVPGAPLLPPPLPQGGAATLAASRRSRRDRRAARARPGGVRGRACGTEGPSLAGPPGSRSPPWDRCRAFAAFFFFFFSSQKARNVLQNFHPTVRHADVNEPRF